MSNAMIPNDTKKMTDAEKVIALYQFIRDLAALKQRLVKNAKHYRWFELISSIPCDPENIEVFYRDRTDEEGSDFNQALLKVRKPEFSPCPMPNPILLRWLNEGWENYKNPLSYKESFDLKPIATVAGEEPEDHKEYLTDDPIRLNLFLEWQKLREEWVLSQERIERTRAIFLRLHQLHTELERESDTLEMIVASGFFRDRNNPEIYHPTVTRRVKTVFDPTDNVISIADTDVQSELYTMIFQETEGLNLDAISSLREELTLHDYHPMDRIDTPSFLKVLAHELSPESAFSETDEPAKWMQNNRILVCATPAFIVRNRIDGTIKAIDTIVETVRQTEKFPPHLGDIVSGGQVEINAETEEASLEDQLAAVGGESIDILLSKEANKEQLEIARRIETYNAVLVQGPPGTGKTHTIANLLGHFLAQGKRVLVTSYTKKALTVLKDKVPKNLQNLCVSVLDDSNRDMERSIDGITDYMSQYTSFELQKQIEAIGRERKDIISQLAHVRKQIYATISKECTPITWNGEVISPSRAAKFVAGHAEDLSYIPGEVRLYSPLPATFEELTKLYRSNEEITAGEEPELEYDLPDPMLLPNPAEFEKRCNRIDALQKESEEISQRQGFTVTQTPYHTEISVADIKIVSLSFADFEHLKTLESYVLSMGVIEPWMKVLAVDGKRGGAVAEPWISLVKQIEDVCRFSEVTFSERFNKNISISSELSDAEILETLPKMRTVFETKGKVSKATLLFNRAFSQILSNILINNSPIASVNDCDLILHDVELRQKRSACAAYWDKLMASQGVLRFHELHPTEPEQVAKNFIPSIERYLDWYKNEFAQIKEMMERAGILTDSFFMFTVFDSETAIINKILSTIGGILPQIFGILKCLEESHMLQAENEKLYEILTSEKRVHSSVCESITSAVRSSDVDAYRDGYKKLESLFAKYDLQKSREEILGKISSVAPEWADAIRRRFGIHGEGTLPGTIEAAWRWKQLSGIVSEIISTPFDELQSASLALSAKYREVTAAYAEKMAWHHLLLHAEHDIDIKQALQGWKLTVKKIGKGTGKNAPMLREKARKLMAKCQRAVPVWIMPIHKALESLVPGQNYFDVIIVDEASQADISALSIAYMGEKLIIVGDDKQVSPLAVGVDLDKMNALQKMYIQDIIPNSHLYNAKTSLYDIAATTFQPLMLREHFRCVPDIIGFSNVLSYDHKIKPLRDAGKSVLHPFVVGYKVPGARVGKVNPIEARHIVSLLKACMEQPEYAGKTFGVISMLGDDQAKLIQSLIFEEIDTREIEARRILCGNASNFQGDERDIIFLSLVDSVVETRPLRIMDFGSEDSNRKRYNVATSRAKDQLWVVHSLDPVNDLKPGDIRKMLIDYANDPSAFTKIDFDAEKKTESPFEASVALALANKGYHIEEQWEVGTYCLDMVAVYQKQTVAIECDGERFHSGDAKIREDMERQTILERLGWRLIRIRGSEYYRSPEKTMEYVTQKLAEYGVLPEDEEAAVPAVPARELLPKTTYRAYELFEELQSEKAVITEDVTAEPQPEEVIVAEDVTAEPQPEEVIVAEDVTAELQPEEVVVAEDVAAEPQPEEEFNAEDIIAAMQSEDTVVAEDVTAEPQPEEVVVTEDIPAEPQPEEAIVAEATTAESQSEEVIVTETPTAEPKPKEAFNAEELIALFQW